MGYGDLEGLFNEVVDLWPRFDITTGSVSGSS